ncbi:LysM peptidoglycan-binding domain-containing protein [Microaerobacter geothermalis]|uniref:LysM peptidoglycan-binding domain-containing protein n=1 Tax=Microaerobacter geothermalis TaxID=674972 RepID=UPI001F1C9213|nr:LysM domain-containing protein [Microaerobacter geothermalis]MCF6093499.1 LysM peptidoglycan-binding domain-containing protein [Microaerobacter geothermalis]
MAEDKKENKLNDQASHLRKKMDGIKGGRLEKEHSIGASLPPRSTVHRKTSINLSRLGLLFVFILIIVFIIVWYVFIYRDVPSTTNVTSVTWGNTDSSIPQERNDLNEDSNDLSMESNDTVQNKVDQKYDEPLDRGKEENTRKNDDQHKEQTGYDKIVFHRVKPGETLYSITMYYYKDKRYVPFLAEYNAIENPRNIMAGVTIKVPLPPPTLSK